MSLATETGMAAAPSDGGAVPQRCELCSAPLAADQEWCLDCGAARTLILRAPDWRVPVVIVSVVVLAVLAAFALALISLSGDANRRAAASVRSEPAAATASRPIAARSASRAAPSATTPTTATAATTPRIASWPIGLPGWTVVLGSLGGPAGAHRLALELGGEGIPVGILNSTEHPSMIPGRWIVFSGRYATESAAVAGADALIARGFTHVRASLVG